MNWQKSLKGELRVNESLAGHTTFKIGGPVQFLFGPKSLSDLQVAVKIAQRNKIPLRVIGSGSNVLVDDRGIRGIVVKLNTAYFKRIAVNKQSISTGAGLSLPGLLQFAQEYGFCGFELLAGIPGTVGGALVMNAGNIAGMLKSVRVMDRYGRIKTLSRKQIQFDYRDSGLSRYIILSTRFKKQITDKKAVRKKINDYLSYRSKTQDLSWPSAGCFFKNPDLKSTPRLRPRRFAQDFRKTLKDSGSAGLTVDNSKPSAAYFIEHCGLKGSCFGGAAVSSKHANFIVNKDNASFTDILRLKEYIIECVRKRFNLILEPEVKIWQHI